MIAAEFRPVESDGRRSRRAPVSFDAPLAESGFDRTLCKVIDLSQHGARLQTFSGLRRGAKIWLNLPEIGPRGATVMWAGDFIAGCEFHDPLSEDEFDTLIELDGTLRRFH